MGWYQTQRIFYLVCMLAAVAFPGLAAASEYHGQVTFGDLPLPGATVTITQGTKKLTAISDQGGLFTFPDLADGPAKIEIEMLCFSTVTADVTISPATATCAWLTRCTTARISVKPSFRSLRRDGCPAVASPRPARMPGTEGKPANQNHKLKIYFHARPSA